MKRPPPPLIWGALIAAIGLLALVSLAAGKVWVPFSAWAAPGADPRWAIIFELRLPRTVLAVVVGGALGLCGAALQGYTRNPLADPSALGVSSMASLGAVLTLYFGLTASTPWLLPAGAMVGAAIGVAVLLALSNTASSIATFILAGMVLNTMAGAGVALALSLAPNPWAVNEIVNWLLGSLTDRSVEEVRLALPFVAVGCEVLLTLGRDLDALTLGETGARSVGVRMDRVRLLLGLGVGLAAGTCVAVTGVIGFVGLITPHLMRPLVGARPGALLIPSALAGAVVVLAGDVAVRLIPSAGEVKLSVAMAAIGGPFFLALLVSMRRRMA